MLDIVLVLDGSDSISRDNFDKVKSSVEDFTRQLDIGTDKIWLGLVLYSTNLTQTIQLTGNKNEILQRISQLKHERLGTNTAAGILKMSELLLYGRPNVPKLGVVVTDGQSLEPTLTRATARAAMDAGVDMYSVGIGDQIDKSELQGLASAPNMSITFDNFDKLTLADIGKEICPSEFEYFLSNVRSKIKQISEAHFVLIKEYFVDRISTPCITDIKEENMGESGN